MPLRNGPQGLLSLELKADASNSLLPLCGIGPHSIHPRDGMDGFISGQLCSLRSAKGSYC